MRRFASVILATLLAVSLVGLVGVGSAGAQGGNERQGVSGTQISVGGLASPPSVLNVPYQDGFAGTKAYFDKVNKAGGLFGKKLKLVAQLSDQGAPSGNIRAVRTLVEEKKVFAVLPIETNSFAGGKYLSDTGIPSFGYDIDAGYCGTQEEVLAIENGSPNRSTPGSFDQCPRQNVFGQSGSYLCFICPSISPAVLAKQIGAKKAAILTYTHPSSTACGDGDEASFKRYGIDIAFEDKTLNFGFPDASADAQAMKDAGVDYVATCMDFGGSYKIAQELKQAGATGVTFYAPEGYRQDTLDKYGSNLNDWIFRIGFTPWQGKNLPKGTKEFLAAMKKAGVKPSEQSQTGWINAALLVAGIKKAGKDFTWSSVNDAINSITDFTADGILPPINWAAGGDGHGPSHEACDAYVAVKNAKFVPEFGKPGQPFVCYPDNPQPANLDTPYYRPLKPGEPDPLAANG